MAATTTARLTINPDTTDEIVLAAPHPEGAERPPARGRRRWWLVPLAVLLLAAIAAAFVRLPYDTIAPGSTRQVNDLVVVRGVPSYPPRGKVLYTTVSVRERVTPYEVAIAWVSSDIDVVSDQSVRGNTPPKQFQQQNVEAMSDSKKVAEAVALERLGYHVVQGSGAVVRSVRPGSPAASVVQPNDVIVAVDGKPVAIEAQAVEAIRAHKPGDRVTLRIVRGTAPPTTVSATLAAGAGGKALLGVVLETAGLQIKLPFQIDIDSGAVVGPSAGAAYALELLDLLTPGELTGGAKIAATGDLHLDGSIGAIGGVAQKAVTVRRAGASVFLVPRENYAEAKAHAGNHLRVYAVDTIDDALRVLGSLKGSNALALGKPASGT
jgi:PDZ domain-containing protein